MQRIASLQNENDIHTVATSYDSLPELLNKYPDAVSIMRKLSKLSAVTVVHGVDATKIAKHFAEKFDEIIFNFPHLGREDKHAHKALVAHYFTSAIECIAIEGSISLALSEEQEYNWDM
jgi:hypothetical protein